MTDIIPASVIEKELLAICEDNPYKVNPVEGPIGLHTCLYRDKVDPDRHCLIGQWATNRGLGVPGSNEVANARNVALKMEWPVDSEGRNMLLFWQESADKAVGNFLSGEETLPTWGEVPALVAERTVSS